MQHNHENLLLTAPLNSNPPLHPPSPFSPRPDPQPHRANSTRPHSLKRALPAATPSTKGLSLSRPLLIHKIVYSTSDRRASRGHRGHVTPVSAEVLHAPDDGEDDGCEGEDGAMAGAGESRDEGRERGGYRR